MSSVVQIYKFLTFKDNPFPHSAPEVLSILQFWFSGSLEEQFQRWFAKGEAQKELDSLITLQYTELLERAEKGELDKEEGWNNTPAGLAAKIILVDQFSRHIYRGNQEKIKVTVNFSIYSEAKWQVFSGLGVWADKQRLVQIFAGQSTCLLHDASSSLQRLRQFKYSSETNRRKRSNRAEQHPVC